MEENASKEDLEKENDKNKDDAKESEKKDSKEAKAKDGKKKDKNKKKGSGFFEKHKAEFKKIKWPTRQELLKETVVVIIVCLAVGVIISGIDAVLQFGFSAVL